MALSKSESDIFINKSNIALAKSQRLIASWLPPQSAKEAPSVETQEDIEKEEQEFLPGPEVLGIGATIPRDGDVKRGILSSNEKLRKQLLGRDYAKKHAHEEGMAGEQYSKSDSLRAGSKPHPIQSRRQANDDSEDDEGRSSLGKSKQTASKSSAVKSADVSDMSILQSENSIVQQPVKQTRPPKRAKNYLDEVLEDRLRKKQKSKKKNKHGAVAEANADA